MPHPRTLIRHAFMDALQAIPGTPALTVQETRVVPTQVRKLPTVAVYTLQEDVLEPDSMAAPREYKRELDVIIECWVDPGENVDDAMDDLALRIETALMPDPFFGGVVADSYPAGTALEVEERGNRQLGWFVLTWKAIYFTTAPTIEDADDFTTAGATHNLANAVHPDNQIEDVFTVQETP